VNSGELLRQSADYTARGEEAVGDGDAWTAGERRHESRRADGVLQEVAHLGTTPGERRRRRVHYSRVRYVHVDCRYRALY